MKLKQTECPEHGRNFIPGVCKRCAKITASIKKNAAVSKKKPNLVEPDVTRKGIGVLQEVLLRLRWHDQGGFVSYEGDGKWSCSGVGLPTVSIEELEQLFELAGIVPDAIESRGSCEDCLWSNNGYERGYSPPCSGCQRPYHSHFYPSSEVEDDDA